MGDVWQVLVCMKQSRQVGDVASFMHETHLYLTSSEQRRFSDEAFRALCVIKELVESMEVR